ncbi:MAG: DUF3784 domain-containing protein [Bacteroidia bacterium]|nr:DUF3784 domain-containing protein [Bacteroidia bacterium]
MDLTIWLPGVLLIILGVLGWKSPHFINIFSKEEKESMDLAGVGKLFRNIFVTIGVLQIVVAYFFHQTSLPLMAGAALLFFVLIGVFVFAFKAEKYKNKK